MTFPNRPQPSLLPLRSAQRQLPGRRLRPQRFPHLQLHRFSQQRQRLLRHPKHPFRPQLWAHRCPGQQLHLRRLLHQHRHPRQRPRHNHRRRPLPLRCRQLRPRRRLPSPLRRRRRLRLRLRQYRRLRPPPLQCRQLPPRLQLQQLPLSRQRRCSAAPLRNLRK